ncbi:hypothetical protein ACIGDI_18580 [Streptomyces sp. NPDC085900]|uniref:hypothetical protein n=1 Tax=Streptomyces sp. NPDC085900 TaxID=3365737 RepID=UPI0037D62D6D
MGRQPGTSNAHFGAWMAALDKETGINRVHVRPAVDAGRSVVLGLLPWAGGLPALAVASLPGLRPRPAEFRQASASRASSRSRERWSRRRVVSLMRWASYSRCSSAASTAIRSRRSWR